MRFICTVSIFGFGIEVYIILILLACPIFLIWRRVFRKFIKSNYKRNIAIWCATIFSTPLIYTTLIVLIFSIMNYYLNQDFDQKQWLTDKDERYQLSKDIIESKMLIGKTKPQIKKLLGDEGNKDENDDWFYDLGFKPGTIDPDSMEIVFKNGKVASVVQHEHH
jgi:hypothetical protein